MHDFTDEELELIAEERAVKPWAGEFPMDRPDRCEDCGGLDGVEMISDAEGSALVCRKCLGLEE